MKRIGILQTGKIGGELGEKFGEYPEMFINMLGADSFDYKTYSVTDGELPTSIDDCDGWIITGSKHGAYEDHDWIPPLEEFIRKLSCSDRPTLGICFGHQIMAQALGGEVVKSDKGWGVGYHDYENLETGTTEKLLAFHQDQVTKLPDGATVTHRSDFCPFAGIRYSDTCHSLQPHPEHKPGFTEALLVQRRGKAIEAITADTALAGLGQANSHAEYANRLKTFFENT